MVSWFCPVLAWAPCEQAVEQCIGQQAQQLGRHGHLPRDDAVAGACRNGPERLPRETLRRHQKRHGVAVLPRQRGIDVARAEGDDTHTRAAQLAAQAFTVTDDGSLARKLCFKIRVSRSALPCSCQEF